MSESSPAVISWDEDIAKNSELILEVLLDIRDLMIEKKNTRRPE